MLSQKTDGGGTSGRIPYIQLSTGLNYEEILSRIDSDAQVIIYTYSIYGDQDYFVRCLGRLNNCRVVINSISPSMLETLTKLLPNIQFEVRNDTHAKIILIAPDDVYLSSQNFSVPDWFQHSVHIKDKDAFSFYHKTICLFEERNKPNNIKQSMYLPYDGKSIFPSSNRGHYVPDYAGIVCTNIKGKYASSVNWNQKLNNVRNRKIYICTQTLPDRSYIVTILTKLFKEGNKVFIIANSESDARLAELKQQFPPLLYYIYNNIHAKMVFFSSENPHNEATVWLSSQNFGSSGWFENLIMLKSNDVYKYYLDKLCAFTGIDL